MTTWRTTASAAAPAAISEETLATMTIRELVDRYPATMEVLAPLGIDLCCGGAHPLGEALDLHGIERTRVLPEIARIVAAASTTERYQIRVNASTSASRAPRRPPLLPQRERGRGVRVLRRPEHRASIRSSDDRS